MVTSGSEFHSPEYRLSLSLILLSDSKHVSLWTINRSREKRERREHSWEKFLIFRFFLSTSIVYNGHSCHTCIMKLRRQLWESIFSFHSGFRSSDLHRKSFSLLNHLTAQTDILILHYLKREMYPKDLQKYQVKQNLKTWLQKKTSYWELANLTYTNTITSG